MADAGVYLGTFRVIRRGRYSGSVTLPKSYCDELDVKLGDKFDCFRRPGDMGITFVPAKPDERSTDSEA